MPRYFFHVMDGRIAVDTTGIEFADARQARHEALRAASEMLLDRETELFLGNRWTMTVADESGLILCNLHVSIDQPRTVDQIGD